MRQKAGALAILQLFHAGNKAVPELIPDGELVSASAWPLRLALLIAGNKPAGRWVMTKFLV
jgi:2,4-dienoyl-CoA reductase-like NADH-dependent reductase (Old Yellow Enzyme family)